MMPSPQEITQLLKAWGDGDQAALDQLMPLVYDELRRIAGRYMRQQAPGHTLQTTALVHEACLKLIGQEEKNWQNRSHFFAVAALAMRHILTDYARSRQSTSHGGGAITVSLEEAATISQERAAEIITIDDALTTLATIDKRKSQVVEMRFFGGLGVEEIAVALKVSPGTVKRDWRLAKLWLLRELSRAEAKV